MNSNQSKLAIQAALESDWKKAISINKKIIEKNPNDIDALNRLGYAFIQFGNFSNSNKIFKKVLKLDNYNQIAKKHLERIKSMKKTKKKNNNDKLRQEGIMPNFFIEETGKTKVISLTNIAPAKILSNFNVGDMVFFYPKKYSIEVRSIDKIYLGALPDDIAFRLIRFLKAGNKYNICIKRIETNNITIFIREIRRGKRFSQQPTFSIGSTK